MPDDGAKEPDRVHTYSLSRRDALMLSAGLAGMAGCAGDPNDSQDQADRGLRGGEQTSDGSTQQPTQAPSEKITVSGSFSIDEATVELDIGSYLESEEDVVTGVLRLYSAPNLNRSDRSVIAETSIEQDTQKAEYSLSPDYDLGYAQHLTVTLELDSEELEISAFEDTIVPFYNEAEDEEMVKVEPPSKITLSQFFDEPGNDIYQTQIWFSENDESKFDVPAISEDKFDPDWYDYKNLTVTALIRFYTYEDLSDMPENTYTTSDAPGVPRLEWTIVNFEVNEWELLESLRWSSEATHALETQERVGNAYSDDNVYYGSKEADKAIPNTEAEIYPSPSSGNSCLKVNGSGRALPTRALDWTPYNAYDSYPITGVNTILFSASRPFSKRIANHFEEAFDNPSFNELEYQDYHKATALKVFVGSAPYAFSATEATEPPERVLNEWYKTSQIEGERDVVTEGSGNCQDVTALFNGIAGNLFDGRVAQMFTLSNNIDHELSGFVDLSKPDTFEGWEDHPVGILSQPDYEYESEIGDITLIECTYKHPAIGWIFEFSEIDLKTYLTESPQIYSFIPLNGELEPDQNGEFRGAPLEDVSFDEPEIPWETPEERAISDIEDYRVPDELREEHINN